MGFIDASTVLSPTRHLRATTDHRRLTRIRFIIYLMSVCTGIFRGELDGIGECVHSPEQIYHNVATHIPIDRFYHLAGMVNRCKWSTYAGTTVTIRTSRGDIIGRLDCSMRRLWGNEEDSSTKSQEEEKRKTTSHIHTTNVSTLHR